MVQLDTLVSYTNTLLDISRFKDYAPNGLQVEGKAEIHKLVSGVTASQELINQAIKAGADLILVHHGYFWKGENACITGLRRRRLSALLENNINLLAYHLPLDEHPVYGNNAMLANVLGFNVSGRFGHEPGPLLGMHGNLHAAMSADELVAHIEQCLGRRPMHIAGQEDGGKEKIQTIAWCTGAAQDYIELAAELGADAYLSGEISEQTVHIAREYGLHYFSAGHHATERYGAQALGAHLAEKFRLDHQYIEIDNPV